MEKKKKRKMMAFSNAESRGGVWCSGREEKRDGASLMSPDGNGNSESSDKQWTMEMFGMAGAPLLWRRAGRAGEEKTPGRPESTFQ
ncbi:hypothetical protein WISP_12375 [Willisornis vidua]|uniref:Uncharacterized protein n=1 Tax=Willisornis vidua TaxID=1566151 RepID=A0ABQ9DQV8_9PASS|nr:hypothetical protein WISP_12375 [Willisornis vidua]